MKTLKDYEYYRTDLGVLYCGDCLEILPLLENESIDLVLTDPPYGIGIHKMAFANNENKKASKNSLAKRTKYDGVFLDTKINIDFILKYNCIIWGGNYFNLPPVKSWLVWDKRTHEKYNNDFADCELAYTNLNHVARVFRYLWCGMLQGNMKDKQERFHPTQKPIELIMWCLSFKNGLVLDPFFWKWHNRIGL